MALVLQTTSFVLREYELKLLSRPVVTCMQDNHARQYLVSRKNPYLLKISDIPEVVTSNPENNVLVTKFLLQELL